MGGIAGHFSETGMAVDTGKMRVDVTENLRFDLLRNESVKVPLRVLGKHRSGEERALQLFSSVCAPPSVPGGGWEVQYRPFPGSDHFQSPRVLG